MKRWAVLFLCANLLAFSAFATSGGSEAGNGGSSIVCQDSSSTITSVELLDFYEARTQRGIKIDLGPATDSVEVKLALLVQRMKRLDEKIAADLQYEVDRFALNSRFYSGVRLVEIPDSQNLFIPAGCQQEQIAIWREPTVPEDRRYNISQDLWNQLDNDGKAGLMLHEMLYYLVLQNQEVDPLSDSRIVRYLVSKLASADAATWKLQNFVEVLRQLHFPSIAYKGYSFVVDQHNPLVWGTDILIGGPLYLKSDVSFQGHHIFVSDIEFDSQGNLSGITPATDCLLKVDGQDVWFQKGKPMQISQDAVLDGYAMPGNQNVFKRPGDYELKLAGLVYQKPIELMFKPDGKLMLCTACEGTVIIGGKTYSVGVPTSYVESDLSKVSLQRWDYVSPISSGFSIFLSSPVTAKVGTQDVTFVDQMIIDDSNTGVITSGVLANATVFEVGGQKVRLAKGEVRFSNSGSLWFGTLDENTVLTAADGSRVMYLAGMQLYFKESGLVSGETFVSRQRKAKNRSK